MKLTNLEKKAIDEIKRIVSQLNEMIRIGRR